MQNCTHQNELFLDELEASIPGSQNYKLAINHQAIVEKSGLQVLQNHVCVHVAHVQQQYDKRDHEAYTAKVLQSLLSFTGCSVNQV